MFTKKNFKAVRIFSVCFILLIFLSAQKVNAATTSFTPLTHAELVSVKASDLPARDSSFRKFIKNIMTKLGFKGKVKLKESERITKILDTYFKKDSISLAELKNKMDKYSKIDRFDSLVKILRSTTVSTTSKLNDRVDSIASSMNDPNRKMSDPEIQQLVDKIAPLIEQKVKEDEAAEQKNKKIVKVRQVMTSPGPSPDSVVVNDSITKKFNLKIKKKEMFGFHPWWTNDKYFNYNFNLVSTLAYYGYQLNAKGGYTSLHGWDTARVISKARKEGCKVQLVVFCLSPPETFSFLKNAEAQEKFCTSVIGQLRKRKANGVNLMFENIGYGCRDRLTQFVRKLRECLKDEDSNYELTITLPCFDKEDDYDIVKLQTDVDYFIINFSRKSEFGPLAPLTGGNYSIEAGLARYLSKEVPASKFMACLPYLGIKWESPFPDDAYYLSYDSIMNIDPGPGVVYEKNGSARLELLDEEGYPYDLWYDDPKTLSKKYDYILANNLRGISVWGMGNDDKHAELWDVMMDKLVTFDTVDVVLVNKNQPAPQKLSFWARVRHELTLYKELFQHPCHFGDRRKMQDLKSDDYIGFVTAALLILLSIISVFSIVKRKNLGDDWENRKLFLTIQIILVVLLMLSLMMFCFLNPKFYYFGANARNDFNNCETSFGTMLTVMGVGLLVGLLAMRFLVAPLLKPKEIP